MGEAGGAYQKCNPRITNWHHRSAKVYKAGLDIGQASIGRANKVWLARLNSGLTWEVNVVTRVCIGAEFKKNEPKAKVSLCVLQVVEVCKGWISSCEK